MSLCLFHILFKFSILRPINYQLSIYCASPVMEVVCMTTCYYMQVCSHVTWEQLHSITPERLHVWCNGGGSPWDVVEPFGDSKLVVMFPNCAVCLGCWANCFHWGRRCCYYHFCLIAGGLETGRNCCAALLNVRYFVESVMLVVFIWVDLQLLRSIVPVNSSQVLRLSGKYWILAIFCEKSKHVSWSV